MLRYTTEGCVFIAEEVTSIISSLIAWRTVCMHSNRISNKPTL